MRHILALSAVLVLAGACLAAEFKSDEAKKAQADYFAVLEAAKMTYGQGLAKAKAVIEAKAAAATDAISKEAIQGESAAITEELVRLRDADAAAFEPREWKSAETRKVTAAYAAELKAAKMKYGQDLTRARQTIIARKAAATDSAAKEALQTEIALIEGEQARLKVGVPAAKELDIGGGVTMKVVRIPAGKFMMGEGETQHEVTLSKPFYMGVTEVTQAQYAAIMGTNPSHFKGATNPVEMVSWNDATEFCKKLSERTRQAVRLPTEAEWEYACRAGTATAFSFGDADSALGDYAWHDANSGSTTHPVGQKKPNVWGLFDMHGNVWEWCADWFGDYPNGAVTDPKGPVSGIRRVLRGGSWGNAPSICRSAYRGSYTPGLRNLRCGFRVVVSVSAPGL